MDGTVDGAKDITLNAGALPTEELNATITATLSPFYDKDRQCTIIVIEGESVSNI